MNGLNCHKKSSCFITASLSALLYLSSACPAFAEAAKPVNLGPKENLKKYEVTAMMPSEKGSHGFKPFIYSMLFCERIAAGLELYKYITFNDLVNIGAEIYGYVQGGGGARFTVHDFLDGRDLVMNFYYKDIEKAGLNFICLSNYLADENKLTNPDGDLSHAWAAMYRVTGGELVDYKYALNLNEKPDESYPATVANYYLQDEDPSNDSKIEGILLSAIKNDKDSRLFMNYAILSQYYMMTGSYDRAAYALKKVLVSPPADGGLTREEIYFFSSMELKMVKKCSELQH